MKLNRKVRQTVIERDKYCVLCNGQTQQIHHVMQLSHCGNNTEQNLVSLCNPCHFTVHTNEKYYFNVLFDILKTHYPNLTREKMKR